jgi:hypothetical protein
VQEAEVGEYTSNGDVRPNTPGFGIRSAGKYVGYQVANFLRTNGVKVFYDEFEQANLWRADLGETLDRIYRTQSDFVAMFISVA